MRTQFITKALAILSITIIIQTCNITEPTMPVWDVSLNIPIVKKEYSILDAIEKNPNIAKYTSKESINNLLYYSNTQNINSISVDDKLKIAGLSENLSETIGQISILDDSITTFIGLDWLGVSLEPGSQTEVPLIDNAIIEKLLSATDQFQSLIITSGMIDITIENHFSDLVTLSFSNLTIKNYNSGNIFLEYNPIITVPSGEKIIISNINVPSGASIQNPFLLSFNVSTTGSNGQKVVLPENTFSFTIKFKDIKASEATAKIPSQEPIIINGLLEIDKYEVNPTTIQYTILENGLLNLAIVNNLDVDAIITLLFPNIKTPEGQIFSFVKAISKKQTTNIFSDFSLKNYIIESTTTLPTNKLSYNLQVDIVPTNDFRTICSTDDVLANVNIDNLQINEFNGKLKPTLLDEIRTSVPLEINDLKDKLRFTELNLRNPLIKLFFNSSSSMEISINGKIEVTTSDNSKSYLNLNRNTLLNSQNIASNIISNNDSVLTIQPDSLTKFFKSLNSLPDSIIVYVNGIINERYQLASIKSTDYINSRALIEFPLDLGLQDGEFTDSIKIELSEDDKNNLTNINEIEAVLTVNNGIPAVIDFTGKLYDEYNRFLMDFPPKYDNQDTIITIGGAIIDSDGNVISDREQIIRVKASTAVGETETDIQKIARAKYMRIKLRINTSLENNLPVRFKTDNRIQIKVAGTTKYSITP